MADLVLGKQFYATRGGAAWHGKGTVSVKDEQATALEVYNRSQGGLEVDVRRFVLVAMDPKTGELVHSPSKVGDDGKPELLQMPGFGLWRWPHAEDPEEVFFNTVSDDYHGLTNQDVCEVLDASGITGAWPVETMGLLDRGRAFFITLDGGEWDIKGDPMKMYFFVREGKDGLRSFNLGITPVRIVCANTERLGLDMAEINIRIPHTKAIKDSISFYSGLIPSIREATERMKVARARLADYTLSVRQSQEVFEAVWSDPPTPPEVRILDAANDGGLTEDQMKRLTKVKERYEESVGKVERVRDKALELLHVRNDDIQPRELAGTAHVTFNVVTEMENYRRGRGEGTRQSILMGERHLNMTRGFQKIEELIAV